MFWKKELKENLKEVRIFNADTRAIAIRHIKADGEEGWKNDRF